MTPHERYLESHGYLMDLIASVERWPDTKKKRTTLRYLYTARENIKFLIAATGE